MNGQVVGYKRVSSTDQETTRQLDGLELSRVFEDKLSGKNADRPALKELINYARRGDTVMVHSMDRLARNLRDLLEITTELTNKGVKVTFLKENITLTGDDSPIAKLMLQLMGSFAEFERSLLRERQQEGIALAKMKGNVYLGRKPKLSADKTRELVELFKSTANKAELARNFGISRASLYSLVKKSESEGLNDPLCRVP